MLCYKISLRYLTYRLPNLVWSGKAPLHVQTFENFEVPGMLKHY